MTIDLDAPAVEPVQRRSRRGWIVVAALFLVATLAAAYVSLSPSPQSAPRHDFSGELRWIASIVDANPRGALAGERAFTRDLAQRIEELAPASPALDSTPVRARVLFAEDIDAHRIALVALQDPEISDDRRRYALTELLWLTGPRGATVPDLTGPLTEPFTGPARGPGYEVVPPEPFVTAQLGDPRDPVWVALAPPQCQIDTAPPANITDWRPVEQGSYLVRRPRQDGPEYWRVTCDGVVREQRAAPRAGIDSRDLEQALATAVGQPDRDRLGYQLSMLYGAYGSEVLEPARVLWSGPVALSPAARDPAAAYAFVAVDPTTGAVDTPDANAATSVTVTIVVAPRAPRGWIGSIWATIRRGEDVVFDSPGPLFVTPTDPGADGALLALHVPQWHEQVLVLAPESAASVQLGGGDGSILDVALATSRAVVLAPGQYGPVGELRVVALDRIGEPVATTQLANTDVRPDAVRAWD